jgi:hypothetical protein
MYKTLGFRWLFEVFYPASAFATTDRDEARNPQRFIHVTVTGKRRTTAPPKLNDRKLNEEIHGKLHIYKSEFCYSEPCNKSDKR